MTMRSLDMGSLRMVAESRLVRSSYLRRGRGDDPNPPRPQPEPEPGGWPPKGF